LVAAAAVVADDVFGLADGDLLEGAFFLSSFALLTVVFFFLTAGLLSVDPVDDFASVALF
jgi:hypothetical protein